jgi:hypothetical protein
MSSGKQGVRWLMRSFADTLCAELRAFEAVIAKASPDLARAASRYMRNQCAPTTVNLRLFAVVVAGAAAGAPHEALPVSVVSSLWWSGVEATASRGSNGFA